MRQDRDAVLSGFGLPRRQGQTDGEIPRLKLIRRQITFDLVRKRVLRAAGLRARLAAPSARPSWMLPNCPPQIACLQEARALPTFHWLLWNVEQVPLIGSGRVAQFLNTLFGCNSRLSIEEVRIWLLYLVIVGYYFFVGRKPTPSTTRQATAAG